MKEYNNSIDIITHYYDKKWNFVEHLEFEKNIRILRRPCFDYVDKFLKNISEKKILDIGCGSGIDSLKFAKRGAIVTGIDVSRIAILKTESIFKKEGVGYREFRVMDAHHLEFPDESFDIVYVNSAFMYLRYKKVIKEIKRVLKPKGVFLMIEPLKGNPFVIIYRWITKKYRKSFPKYITPDIAIYMGRIFSDYQIKFFLLISPFLIIFKNIFKEKTFFFILKQIHYLDRILIDNIAIFRRYAWMIAGVYFK